MFWFRMSVRLIRKVSRFSKLTLICSCKSRSEGPVCRIDDLGGPVNIGGAAAWGRGAGNAGGLCAGDGACPGWLGWEFAVGGVYPVGGGIGLAAGTLERVLGPWGAGGG